VTRDEYVDPIATGGFPMILQRLTTRARTSWFADYVNRDPAVLTEFGNLVETFAVGARRAPGSLAGCQAVIRYPLKLRAPVEPGIASKSCGDPCQLRAAGHILTVRDHPDQPRLDPAPGPAVPSGDLCQVSPRADLNDQLFLLLPCPPGARRLPVIRARASARKQAS
jgi:hypothetical protein